MKLINLFFCCVLVFGLMACSQASHSENPNVIGDPPPPPSAVIQPVMAAQGPMRTIQVPAKTIRQNVKVFTQAASVSERVIPPVTRTITKQVVDRPARTIERTIPAQTQTRTIRDPQTGQTRTETIVVREASTDVQVIPPTYRTIQETVIVQEARVESVTIPPQYRTETVELLKPRDPFHWGLDPDNSLPFFNPPPTPIQQDIDNRYFKPSIETDKHPSLRDVYEQITSTLTSDTSLRYGYRVYKYKSGYAILTDPERIDNDGKVQTTETGTRLDMRQENARNFREYIQAFFRVPENRIRYIAFIVTAERHIESSPDIATPDGLKDIFLSGGTHRALPLNILADYEFDDRYRVQVRVYEFPSLPKVKINATPEAISGGLNQETALVELEAYDPDSFIPVKFENHMKGSFALREFFGTTQ